MPDRAFTITRVRMTDAGYPDAFVSVNGGPTVHVDRRYGSWQADIRPFPGAHSFVRRPVLPHVAQALQDRARRLERETSHA